MKTADVIALIAAVIAAIALLFSALSFRLARRAERRQSSARLSVSSTRWLNGDRYEIIVGNAGESDAMHCSLDLLDATGREIGHGFAGGGHIPAGSRETYEVDALNDAAHPLYVDLHWTDASAHDLRHLRSSKQIAEPTREQIAKAAKAAKAS